MRRIPDPRRGVWPTPDWVFKPLNQLLHFDLDAAAGVENAKCRRYFTKEKSALERPWDGRSNWCNPPYGQDPGTDVWVQHGRGWAERLRNRTTMCIPVKADTVWYHDLVWGRNRVQTSAKLVHRPPLGRSLSGRWYQLDEGDGFFVELLELRGRIPFDGPNTGFIASAIVLFNAGPVPVLPRLEQLDFTRGRTA